MLFGTRGFSAEESQRLELSGNFLMKYSGKGFSAGIGGELEIGVRYQVRQSRGFCQSRLGFGKGHRHFFCPGQGCWFARQRIRERSQNGCQIGDESAVKVNHP